jgi:hypothetical protein
MNSRDEFIRQVAKVIKGAQNDSTIKESFIFGLSAKWGEGKTTFIESLSKELGDGWTRFDINPWKYSNDKATFLQAFLISLGADKDKVLKTEVKNKIDRKASKSSWIALVIFILFAVVLTVVNFVTTIPAGLNTLLTLVITGVLIPVSISLFNKTSTTTSTDRQSSALIDFDNLLGEALEKHRDKRVLVVVDDLDRVSARSAIEVLDNLRTFFDKPELSFIVSGDHSVMERYIGNELLPDGKSEERLEEGRRYLKKIFNIYWRMPIPTDAEIENYISDTMKAKLQDAGLRDDETSQLAELLNSLFENNYRNIERMVSQIAFTLQIVRGKLDSCGDDETSIYYEDLSRHKMLLVKVLLIQELANPYYEHLLSASDDLRLSDKNQKIQPEGAAAPQLTSHQRRFLEVLIKAEPRFHGNNGLVVYDMKPFIFLSADSNFGDNRGLLPKEFHARLSESLSDAGEFEKLLQQHSIGMLRKGIVAMIAERKTVDEKSLASTQPQVLPTTGMAQELIALINRLNEPGDEYAAQKQEFKTYFDPEVITQYVGLNSNEYAEMVFALGELYKGDAAYTDSVVDCADEITVPQYLLLIRYADDESVNPLFESILWKCFENLGAQNMDAFISQFGAILDKLSAYSLPDSILDLLVSRVQTNCTDETAMIAARIILKSGNTRYIDDAIDKTKALLPQQQPLLPEILRILDSENSDSHLLEYIDTAVNCEELYERMHFAIAYGLDADKAWQHVIDSKLEVLIGVLDQSAPNPYPESPSNSLAKYLAQKVVHYAKDNDMNFLLSSIVRTAFLLMTIQLAQDMI